MNQPQLPNFVMIGAGKAGSTAVHRYLSQHPDIFLSPVKETNFFSYEGGRPAFTGPGDDQLGAARNPIVHIDDYRALFSQARDESALGEASPSYLYVPAAPVNLQRHIPDAKIIAVLRDPTERAYSNYCMFRTTGREPLNEFAEAVKHEPRRIEEGWAPTWHYVAHGFYYQQLKRYYELFSAENIRVYFFEDLKADATTVMADIFRFLDVDDSFKPNVFEKHNVTGMPKNARAHAMLNGRSPLGAIAKRIVPERLGRRALSFLRKKNLQRMPALSADVRRELIEVYRDDVLALQTLTGRDLSRWLQVR